MIDATLGKYTIVRQLGFGGMAEVYLCRLKGIGGFDKQVVVKRIRADIKDGEGFVDMFLDEARVAANLSHANIVQIFEIDELEGMPYIAMEYVRGPTFARLLRQLPSGAPRPYGKIAYLVSGIAAGLHYAHNARDAAGRQLGIVHRDISPHNVIVSLDGTPKVFDFGVAKARGNLAMTGVGSIKGKIGYMAPEQLRALPVDYRADIYALGVCLYEATLGRRPFVGKTEAELFAARVEGVFPRPSELDPTYPPELEAIVLRAMDPDPDRRPNGEELQLALADVASGPLASSTPDLGRWVGKLFPDDDARELAGSAYAEAYVSGPGSASGEQSIEGRSSRRFDVVTPLPTSIRPSRRRLVVAAAALVVVCVAGYIVVRTSHTTADHTPTAAVTGDAPTSADNLRLYLAEVKRLAASHRWDAARDMLAKARKYKSDDAALEIEIAKLDEELELGDLRTKARHALDTHDRVAARAAVDRLLQRAPDDADGHAMLAELTPAPAEPATTSATVSRTRPTAKTTKRPTVTRIEPVAPAAHDQPPAPTPIAPIAAAPVPTPPAPQPPPHAPIAAPPDAGVAAIVTPRLPASYSARTMKELSKVLTVIEGEAIDRGGVPSSLRGVTSGIAEEAFSAFAPGQLIEVHPSAIYYAIVRAARAGKSADAIAADLRSAYAHGKL